MSLKPATFDLTLALADDALVLAHRLSEWSGQAPTLEEDIALSNLGLDLIGQARALYGYAAELEGKGRDEDDFAYFREAVRKTLTNPDLIAEGVKAQREFRYQPPEEAMDIVRKVLTLITADQKKLVSDVLTYK